MKTKSMKTTKQVITKVKNGLGGGYTLNTRGAIAHLSFFRENVQVVKYEGVLCRDAHFELLEQIYDRSKRRHLFEDFTACQSEPFGNVKVVSLIEGTWGVSIPKDVNLLKARCLAKAYIKLGVYRIPFPASHKQTGLEYLNSISISRIS